MEHHSVRCLTSPGDSIPDILRGWREVPRPCFTVLSCEHVLAIVTGAILAPGKRTITARLRMTGRGRCGQFRLLSPPPQSGSMAAVMTRRLLTLIVNRLVPDGPVFTGVHDTIEQRWGRKIEARGIYRDPVRSSQGHFVKASGLR